MLYNYMENRIKSILSGLFGRLFAEKVHQIPKFRYRQRKTAEKSTERLQSSIKSGKNSAKTGRNGLVKEKILIKNGYLVNPGAKEEGYADLLLEDGRIKEIVYRGTKPDVAGTDKKADFTADEGRDKEIAVEAEGCEIIDASGKYIFPGLVDVHSHFRDPGFTYKEDIYTGAKAAAAGGYTSVVLMCNTKPVVDTPETLSYVLKKGAETDIHVYSCSSVSMGLKGKELTDMEEMKKSGAVGFTDDGIPLMDAGFLEEAMKKAAALNLPVSLHEEDKTMISENGINRGRASEFYGIGGSPKEAEISLIARDLEIALKTGVTVDIQHVSAKESVALIKDAVRRDAENGDGKKRKIHAEATPQHFTLTEDAVIEKGAVAKLNPPLRTEEDRLGIIEGLRDNTIDLIATDHAPHAPEEKAKSITEAPSGMLGLETALSLSYEKLVLEAEIPLPEVIAKLTCNPAGVYGLNAGTIRKGASADLCIFDPDAEYVVKEFHSKSVNSPFLGRKMKGQVVTTICNGKIIYERQ